jgi:ABC-type iron transport system FetAB ATPase subunit
MIELQDVSKIYTMGQVEVKALDQVNLKIERGEFISIIGPSGSGKSTLLTILGVLDLPTEGEYLLEGTDITDLDEDSQAPLIKLLLFPTRFFADDRAYSPLRILFHVYNHHPQGHSRRSFSLNLSTSHTIGEPDRKQIKCVSKTN